MKVRISTRSSAALQHNFVGVLTAKNSLGELLVDLTPNVDGMYGGSYWFPPDDLESFNGHRWEPLNPHMDEITLLPVHVPGTTQKPRRRDAGRNREIVRSFRDGEAATAIAKRYGITRQRVYHIIRKALP